METRWSNTTIKVHLFFRFEYFIFVNYFFYDVRDVKLQTIYKPFHLILVEEKKPFIGKLYKFLFELRNHPEEKFG